MILKNLKKRIITSTFLLFLVYLIFTFNIFLVFILILLAVLSILEFLQLIKKVFKNKFYNYLSSFIFIIYIFIFCIMFFFFSNFLQLKILLFSLLLGCVASDIGGFIVGNILKGPKLTKISPKKTISGAVGSVIFTVIVISGFFYYFTNSFSYKILIIAIATSCSCQIGDLIFSFLKRKAKLKDTGNFLPGHGGILDRVDGILLGVPIGFLALNIFY